MEHNNKKQRTRTHAHTHLCRFGDHEGAEADDHGERDLREGIVDDVAQRERTQHSQHHAHNGACETGRKKPGQNKRYDEDVRVKYSDVKPMGEGEGEGGKGDDVLKFYELWLLGD